MQCAFRPAASPPRPCVAGPPGSTGPTGPTGATGTAADVSATTPQTVFVGSAQAIYVNAALDTTQVASYIIGNSAFIQNDFVYYNDKLTITQGQTLPPNPTFAATTFNIGYTADAFYPQSLLVDIRVWYGPDAPLIFLYGVTLFSGETYSLIPDAVYAIDPRYDTPTPLPVGTTYFCDIAFPYNLVMTLDFFFSWSLVLNQ
jgi:hypothetical protein